MKDWLTAILLAIIAILALYWSMMALGSLWGIIK